MPCPVLRQRMLAEEEEEEGAAEKREEEEGGQGGEEEEGEVEKEVRRLCEAGLRMEARLGLSKPDEVRGPRYSLSVMSGTEIGYAATTR
eukprot:2881628-Rhodomonas_salina.1